MTQPIPENILDHLDRNHVLALCVCDEMGPWAANCFYVFDPLQTALVILTQAETRHGAQMLKEPVVAGVIAGQPKQVRDICGIQLLARATRLEDLHSYQAALHLFTTRHPFADSTPSDVWRLELISMKFTDNSIAFGRKTHWTRR